MRRVPSGLTISISAFRQSSAGKCGPALRPARRYMAKVAVFLDAESATLAPGERLVIPQATRIQTDVAADRPHIAQDGRGNGRGGFAENRKVLAEECGALDLTDGGESANFHAAISCRLDPAQVPDCAKIENVLGFEQLLPHRRNKV